MLNRYDICRSLAFDFFYFLERGTGHLTRLFHRLYNYSLELVLDSERILVNLLFGLLIFATDYAIALDVLARESAALLENICRCPRAAASRPESTPPAPHTSLRTAMPPNLQSVYTLAAGQMQFHNP